MLLESVLLYKTIYAGVLKFSEPYRKEVVSAENEKWGVYRCKDLVAICTSPKEVGGAHSECIAPPFRKEEDPLGIILDADVVYLTVPEIKYFSGVEDSECWDEEATVRALAHVKKSQLIRHLCSQA